MMALTFDGVTFRYGLRGIPVFRDISWSVPTGRTVLLGPNGAGKSTDDLEDSYDTVAVMFGGRIAFSGTVGDFLSHAPSGSDRAALAAYSALAAARGAG
jgi:ABC-type multidrug transport system ATPase subunit